VLSQTTIVALLSFSAFKNALPDEKISKQTHLFFSIWLNMCGMGKESCRKEGFQRNIVKPQGPQEHFCTV
jgi:hypothetical protein